MSDDSDAGRINFLSKSLRASMIRLVVSLFLVTEIPALCDCWAMTSVGGGSGSALLAGLAAFVSLGCGDANGDTLGSFGTAGTLGTSGGSSGSAGSRPSAGAGGSASAGGNAPSGGATSVGGALDGSAGSLSGASGSAGGVGGGNVAGGAAGGGGPIVGDMPLVYDTENTGMACAALPAPPAFGALPAVTNLPDPFAMASGTRIGKREEWACRRSEISSTIQSWGSGPKGAPPANVTATLASNKLTVAVTQGGVTINLSATITLPSGAGPFPLVIGMNSPTGSLPASIFSGKGIATMSFTSSQLVSDGFNVTRGAGDYFKAYPDKNSGAMIEWAWGVSRIIDGLYKTADQNKVDLKHIGVTGCSYQGKMALYAGAFDERIALVMPEESGGGGEAAWRFMATQTGTEDLEAAQGTAWYAEKLKQFKNADAPKLPFDMHELVAMVAPRAILAIENTAIDRLGSQAGSVSMRAAAEVYKALGIPDRIGFTQAAASGHCQFPSSQTADVQAFVDKFLLGKTGVNTTIAKSSYNTDLAKWVTWTTPALK